MFFERVNGKCQLNQVLLKFVEIMVPCGNKAAMKLKMSRILAGGMVFIMIGCTIVSAAPRGIIKVKLNGLEVGIDEQTGGLRLLAHPATGTILEAEPLSADLLDVAYPVQDFLPLRLATRFSRARIDSKDDALTIIWDRLGPSRSQYATLPTGQVSAQVNFRAAPDGRSVILTCRIDNQSSGTIPQILFPNFQGLRPFAGTEQTLLQFANGAVKPFAGPARVFDTMPASWTSEVAFWVGQGWRTYSPVGLYTPHALRWLDLGSYKGGLSMFQKCWGGKMIPTIYTHRTESDPNQLRLAWENRLTIGPGKSWISDEFWLTPHAGGWAKGIEVFREYVWKVNPPRQLPRHIRDGLAFQTIMMSVQAENDPNQTVFRFKDLPRVASDAREHGILEIVPWFWCRLFDMPIVVDERLGTTEEFAQAVRQCKDMGVNISPFVDVKIVPKTLARRYGVSENASGFQGSSLIYHSELIPNLDAYYMDPAFVHSAPAGYPSPMYDIILLWPDKEDARNNVKNDLWAQDVPLAFQEWIDRGVTSFAWDLFHSVVTPGGQRSVVVDVTEKIRAMARARDPESVFCGESAGNVEYESPVLDYTWCWYRSLDCGPVMNVLRTPRENYNVEDNSTEIKQAFAAGLFINIMPRKLDGMNGSALIGDRAVISAALKQTGSLRRQFLPYFTEGFALGDSMLAGPSSGFIRGYQWDGKLLLIVLNDKDTTQTINLKSNLSNWLSSAGHWTEKYYDNHGKLLVTLDGKGGNWSGSTKTLKQGEFGFFEIETK